MKHIFKQRGFTLIELLVVISIIGILASIIYANFNEARVDARNKSLQSSIKETQLALELFKAQEGRYPEAASVGGLCSGITAGVHWAQSTGCGANPIIVDLMPDFIATLPAHQQSANTNCNIRYQTDATGTWYKLTAERCHGGAVTAAEGVQPDSEFARCLAAPACTSCNATYQDTAAFYESYAVYSVGGQCE